MTQDIVDRATYAELSETMGADFAAELVATFLDDAPNMLADLKASIAAQDEDAYRRAAHSIKSNAQVFGATSLAAQARDMELGGLPSDAKAAKHLEDTYAQTALALKGLLDE